MKLTARDLIEKQAEKGAKKPPLTIEVPSLGGELVFQAPDKRAVLDLLDVATKVATGGGMEEMYEGFVKAIYSLCDTFKDPELHEAYGVKAPYDIVEMLLEPQEIISIGELLVDSSQAVRKVDEAIKNF